MSEIFPTTGNVGRAMNDAFNDLRADPTKKLIDISTRGKNRRSLPIEASTEGLMVDDYAVPWDWILNAFMSLPENKNRTHRIFRKLDESIVVIEKEIEKCSP